MTDTREAKWARGVRLAGIVAVGLMVAASCGASDARLSAGSGEEPQDAGSSRYGVEGQRLDRNDAGWFCRHIETAPEDQDSIDMGWRDLWSVSQPHLMWVNVPDIPADVGDPNEFSTVFFDAPNDASFASREDLPAPKVFAGNVHGVEFTRMLQAETEAVHVIQMASVGDDVEVVALGGDSIMETSNGELQLVTNCFGSDLLHAEMVAFLTDDLGKTPSDADLSKLIGEMARLVDYPDNDIRSRIVAWMDQRDTPVLWSDLDPENRTTADDEALQYLQDLDWLPLEIDFPVEWRQDMRVAVCAFSPGVGWSECSALGLADEAPDGLIDIEVYLPAGDSTEVMIVLRETGSQLESAQLLTVGTVSAGDLRGGGSIRVSAPDAGPDDVLEFLAAERGKGNDANLVDYVEEIE